MRTMNYETEAITNKPSVDFNSQWWRQERVVGRDCLSRNVVSPHRLLSILWQLK